MLANEKLYEMKVPNNIVLNYAAILEPKKNLPRCIPRGIFSKW